MVKKYIVMKESDYNVGLIKNVRCKTEHKVIDKVDSILIVFEDIINYEIFLCNLAGLNKIIIKELVFRANMSSTYNK